MSNARELGGMFAERRASARPDVGSDGWDALVRTPVAETRADLLLDAITHRAAILFNVPIAVASLRDDARHILGTSIGLGLSLAPEDLARCAELGVGSEPIFFLDPRSAPCFAGDAVVHGGVGIRFYAAAPVIGPKRRVLGVLCVMDRRARAGVAAEELSALKALATQAASAFATSPGIEIQKKPDRF
jgi:GAF domain-containing protein